MFMLRKNVYFLILVFYKKKYQNQLINESARKNLATLALCDLWGHTHLFGKLVSSIMIAFKDSFDKVKIYSQKTRNLFQAKKIKAFYDL